MRGLMERGRVGARVRGCAVGLLARHDGIPLNDSLVVFSHHLCDLTADVADVQSAFLDGQEVLQVNNVFSTEKQ